MFRDATNRFLVGVQGDYIRVLAQLPPMMTKADALNLAAHLVALADDHNEFPKLLEAVQNGGLRDE